jgi:hypothetical protein
MADTDLTSRVVLFSIFLREHGFKALSSGTLDALRSLQIVDICTGEDFFSALRANLVSTDLEWKLFRELFDQFWKGVETDETEKKTTRNKNLPDRKEDVLITEEPSSLSAQKVERDLSCRKEYLEGATFSPVAVLEKRDLSRFKRGDIQVAQLILKQMMAPFRVAPARRLKRSRKPGDIHFRLVMKRSMKSSGIPMELFYRKKKKRLKRLVILADVSGSMDRYARFVMPFIMGLKGIGSRAEAYVFSTSLTAISPILRKFHMEKVLEVISNEVPDWSGGTRIGESFRQFRHTYGQRHLNRRTVILIMSDGWDLGAKKMLMEEMKILSNKAHSIMWLNPLAGDLDYRPICGGMQIALPYIDYFLPADNLQSLKRVGRTLARVMAG